MSVRITPVTVGLKISTIQAREDIRVPIVTAFTEAIFWVARLIRTVSEITTSGPVISRSSVSAFGSMYLATYRGSVMNSCQYTTQYPVKITRNSMNLGFESTVTKFRPVSAREGGGTSPSLRGSLNISRTAKNIRNTLTAATRKTFSTLMCRWTYDATKGPAA